MEQGIKGNAAKGVLLIQIKVRKPFKPGADLEGSVNIHIDPSFGEAFEIDLFLKDLFPR